MKHQNRASHVIQRLNKTDHNVADEEKSIQKAKRAILRARRWHFIHAPVTWFRRLALRAALQTLCLSNLKIEVIPAYKWGVPVKNQYNACVRTSTGKGTMGADGHICATTFEGLPAYIISVQKLHFPTHAIRTPWLRL